MFFGTPVDLPPDPAGIKYLIEEKLGFIGISAYAPMTGPGFSPSELENAAFNIKVRASVFMYFRALFGRVLCCCVSV